MATCAVAAPRGFPNVCGTRRSMVPPACRTFMPLIEKRLIHCENVAFGGISCGGAWSCFVFARFISNPLRTLCAEVVPPAVANASQTVCLHNCLVRNPSWKLDMFRNVYKTGANHAGGDRSPAFWAKRTVGLNDWLNRGGPWFFRW